MPTADQLRISLKSHREHIALIALLVAMALTVGFFLWPHLIGLLGVIGSWTGGVLITILTHWDASERAFGRLLSYFGWAGSRIERLAIAAEMEGTINGARAELSGELADVMAYPARIRFVRDQGDLARLHEGQVVVSLANPRKRAENLATATLAYVAASTIRPARPYVDRSVMAAVDFSIAKRILRKANGEALDYFFDTLWGPAVHNEPGMRELCHQVEVIERHGVLTRVLLAEFLELGRRLFGSFPQPDAHVATIEFLHRLYRIVTKPDDKELGDDLFFAAGPLRVGIVLVADPARAKSGAGPYIWRCRHNIKRGCDALYLLARGRRNIALLETVLEGMRGDGRVLSIDGTPYDVTTQFGPVNVLCARIVLSQAATLIGIRPGRPRGRRPQEGESRRVVSTAS